MKNRDAIMRRLDKIENGLTGLDYLMKRGGSREEYENIVKNLQELTEETKGFIQQEPLSPGELNQY